MEIPMRGKKHATRGGGKLAMAVTLVERDLSFMPRMGDSFPCQQWEGMW